MTWSNVGPVFAHDCEQCEYLGSYEEHDLYCCVHHSLPTVIARWGGAGLEYSSGMVVAKSRDFKSMEDNAPAYSRALRVAYLIARDLGRTE